MMSILFTIRTKYLLNRLLLVALFGLVVFVVGAHTTQALDYGGGKSRTVTNIRLNEGNVGDLAYHVTFLEVNNGTSKTTETDLTPAELTKWLETPALNQTFQTLEKQRLEIGTQKVESGQPLVDPSIRTTREANANTGPDSIANFIGWVLFYIASGFSAIVSYLITMMVTVAQYNNFLDHRIVITGWQIVRDICNNFFIIALLIIAVATILRQPGNYQYQQAMPKLLLMAVLINFSKVFTGILIDLSQVFTLFFAGALSKDNGIILYALGLYNYYQAGWGSAPQAGLFGNWQVVLQLLLALILSVIAAVVIVSIVGVLIYRIVTLWFLVILSPAAFLAYGIPGQSGRFNQWLGKLSKELIVAPVMLFFLYLSLFAGAVDPASPQSVAGTNGKTLNAAQGQFAITPGTGVSVDQTGSAIAGQLINFGLIIGLMVGSLLAGQQMGASGSKMAGAGFNRLDGWRKKGVGALRAAPGAIGQAADDRIGARAAVMRGLSQAPILRSTPFLGRALSAKTASLQAGTAKREQEAVSNRSAALRVEHMDEEQKRNLARTGDRFARVAATQSLVQNGQIRDDDEANRAENLQLVNQARQVMATSPELQAKFDDSLRKFMPALAASSTLYMRNGQLNMGRMDSDIRTGKLDASKLMANIHQGPVNAATGNSQLFDALNAGAQQRVGGNANDAMARWIMRNADHDEKDMAKVFSAMNDTVKTAVNANLDETSFYREGRVAGAPITPEEAKNRDAFLKASGAFGRLGQVFTNADQRDTWAKENGDLIASKASADQIEAIIQSVGHALDPKQIDKIKNRGQQFETALQGAFTHVLDALDPAEVATQSQRARNLYQNAMLSGSQFNWSANTARRGQQQQLIDRLLRGKKREDILKNMHTNNIDEHMIIGAAETLTDKDYKTLRDRGGDDRQRTNAALQVAAGTVGVAGSPLNARAQTNILRQAAAAGQRFSSSSLAPAGSADLARHNQFIEVARNVKLEDLQGMKGLTPGQIQIIAETTNTNVIKAFLGAPGDNGQLVSQLSSTIRSWNGSPNPVLRDRYTALSLVLST